MGGDLYRLVYGDEHLLRHTKDSYRDLQGLVMPSYLLYLSSSYLLLVSLLLLYSCLNSLFYKYKWIAVTNMDLVLQRRWNERRLGTY